MRLPKRGERGFTLIELLIVVAILGVLAAVVIPNVQRFIGAGEEEAGETELSNIQAAVSAMMVDNEISVLPAGTFIDGTTNAATNDMSAFPETDATLADKGADTTFAEAALGAGYTEVPGYLLYGHQLVIDRDGDGVFDAELPGPPIVPGDEIRIVNYVAQRLTSEYYFVDAYGTVYQVP